MALYHELIDVLQQRPRPESAGPARLKDIEFQRLRQGSSVRLTSTFWPRLAEKTPDWGWRSAHQVTLRNGGVGALAWQGRVGSGIKRSVAWVELIAPAGLACEVERVAGDVASCVVSWSRKPCQWVRIAPRSEKPSIEFETRISYPNISGVEIRWTPAPVGEIRFPF